MDESWRMRMGMPNLPRRKSTEHTSSNRTSKSIFGEFESLDPNEFNDVFGGPPRTVLSRKFSNEVTGSTSFYEEIFRPPEPTLSSSKSGRHLPAFRIPATKETKRGYRKSEGFYCDIFGSDDDVSSLSKSRSSSKSKSKSKSNSSSVLSSEDLSPLRPVIGDDVALPMFASKLRPINVPCRWSSSKVMPTEHPKQEAEMPPFPCNPTSYNSVKNQLFVNDYDGNFSSSGIGFSRQVSSPEDINLEEPDSYRRVKLCGDDVEINDIEINSPSSAVSSVCQEFPEASRGKVQDSVMQDQDEDEDDEVMSSYVIEINSDHREGNGEAISIDEAIAWAKEKYQTHLSSGKTGMDGPEVTHTPMEKEPSKWVREEENQQPEKKKLEVEMELLDEDIQLWSKGKEANIRLLLSTLHRILWWPNSGWCGIPLTSLIEASCVKKAYQKARLCLHPDKLQQRGATFPQKYVAEKAFSILQDAWAAFISHDVFSS